MNNDTQFHLRTEWTHKCGIAHSVWSPGIYIYTWQFFVTIIVKIQIQIIALQQNFQKENRLKFIFTEFLNLKPNYEIMKEKLIHTDSATEASATKTTNNVCFFFECPDTKLNRIKYQWITIIFCIFSFSFLPNGIVFVSMLITNVIHFVFWYRCKSRCKLL